MADMNKIKLPNNNEYWLKDSKAYSRGEQLVTNGTAILGNNTNFSTWTYDGSVANGSGGSFTLLPVGRYTVPVTDDYFPINSGLTYRLDIDFVSKLGIGRMYTFPAVYDVDKKEIVSNHHMYMPNTLTTLSADLNPGDTIVHLTDLTNWNVNTETRTYQRGFIFWNYTNSFGYTYPENTYSRNVYTNLYQDSNVDKTAKTITLDRAWTGVKIVAGTKVSQSQSGANYKYIATSYTQIPTTWTSYTGYIGGVDYSGGNVSSKFPPAVAYAKIGFLWNYNGSGNNEQIWTANVSFKEVPALAKTAETATNASNATLARDVGETSITLHPQSGDEINFGGSSSNTDIYIGYRAIGNRQIPTKFIFGGSSGTATLQAAVFITGSGAENYFQTRKFRGEGNADAYTHAIDFGYAGHNQVDFYEYGGIYNFHKHTSSAKDSGDTLLGTINDKGWDGKVNGHTVNSDVPSNAKFTDTTISMSMDTTDTKKLIISLT